MNPLSQDSCVSSSEETRIKRESSVGLLDKVVTHSVDSGIDSVCSPLKYDCVGTSANDDSKLTKSFPWITEFSKLCQAEIGLTKIHSLENLMMEFIRHVSVSALECHLKPNRAAKLKKTMNGTLLLFHLFYSDIKKPLEHSSYLDKMSDLMAIYIDMEITASSRSKEILYKIASKLTSSLFIFLDRSHDHILDSIFKTKYMNKNYWSLCNLIFTRVLRESPGRAVCDMTYVRYILAFKMWKRVVKGIDEKRNIMKLATMKLHPPPHFKESVRAGIFSGILPKIPKSRNDITMFLMQAKFCIKETTKAFLKQVSLSEKRGSLSSYMANFDRIPFSNHNDTDDSRVSSEEDQEDNCGSSAALMNNIWSSMSGESGVAHQIRISDIIKGRKQKSKCKKTKCKGIATPVFKTSNQTCESVDKLKKKRRLQGIGELPAIKPLPTSLLTDKCGGQSNVTVVRPRIETESALQVSNVESCQSSPVSHIKKEPDLDMCVDDIKSNEQVNQVDSVCEGDEDDKLLQTESNTDSKPLEVFSAVQYRVKSAATADTKNEAVVRPTDRTQAQETCANQAASVKDEQQCQSSEYNSSITAQSLINQTVEKIKETGRRYSKSQIKVQKLHITSDQNHKPDLDAQKLNQEKGTLHDQTLRRDYNIFTSQHAFRSNILNNSVSPEMAVPSPYDNDGFEEASKRCACVQCSANQTALITNYKILTQYLESKQGHCETAGNSNLDKNQDPEPSSCLPFKKRKTLPMDKEEEERDSKSSSGTRDDQVSYPNTPMISIAMLDPKAQSTLGSEPSTLLAAAIDYSLSCSSISYETQPSSFVHPSTEQMVAKPETVPQAILQSNTQTTYPSLSQSQPFKPPANKPKFKTPAQLKECPIKKPSDNVQVAQTPNVVSISKRKSSNSQHNSRDSTAQPKSKVKAKVDKNLRKRKY